jgi:hypothetical protein
MNAGRVLAMVVFASALVALSAPQAAAQTCRWDGTAPFCDGGCGSDESEMARLDEIPPHWTPPFVNVDPPFGSSCWTGSKALCCKTPGRTCRWDGTAPFCEGECGPGETPATEPEGSFSGNACVSGRKVYCCRSTSPTGVVRSRLESNPDLTRYAGLWEKARGPAWQARHGLSSAQYQQVFDSLAQQGYRLVEISGYSVADQATYAAIWEQRQGPAWVARHGLTAEQHQQEFDRLSREGYRLVDISGYAVGGRARYAAIWEQRQGPAWVARHGLTSAQYQETFDRLAREGYRLVDVSGYNVDGEDRYAAIWEQGQGPAFVARHGLLSDAYQEEFTNLARDGYRLTRVSGYHTLD